MTESDHQEGPEREKKLGRDFRHHGRAVDYIGREKDEETGQDQRHWFGNKRSQEFIKKRGCSREHEELQDMEHDVCPWNKSQEHEEDAIKRRGYSGGTKVGKRREKRVDAGFYILSKRPIVIAVYIGVHPEEKYMKHEKCTGHYEDDSGKFFHKYILPILPYAGINARPPGGLAGNFGKSVVENPDQRSTVYANGMNGFMRE